MLPNLTGQSLIGNLVNQYFLLYRSDIMTLNLKWWKEEDLREKSLLQYDVMQYYNCLYYVILIWLEVRRGIHTDWEWYEDNFKIEDARRCFACNNIDLDDVLEIFNLPFEDEEARIGIEFIGVEESFIVEPTSLVPSTSTPTVVDINELLANPSGCTNLVESEC